MRKHRSFHRVLELNSDVADASRLPFREVSPAMPTQGTQLPLTGSDFVRVRLFLFLQAKFGNKPPMRYTPRGDGHHPQPGTDICHDRNTER